METNVDEVDDADDAQKRTWLLRVIYYISSYSLFDEIGFKEGG
jgi:hypothetical protein